MRTRDLFRYPVKSAQGEQLERSVVTWTGLDGDRVVAAVDPTTGRALTARRLPRLLFLRAAFAQGRVTVTTEDGRPLRSDADVSAWLEREVELRRPPVFDRPVYESPVDQFDEGVGWETWQGPVGVWHDSTRTQVSITTADTLGDHDPRRFRPNLVLDAGDERDLVGQRIRLGTCELDVVKEVDRCVVVTREQPGGIGTDREVLRQVHRDRGGNLAVGALVAVPGVVAVGDEVVVLGPHERTGPPPGLPVEVGPSGAPAAPDRP